MQNYINIKKTLIILILWYFGLYYIECVKFLLFIFKFVVLGFSHVTKCSSITNAVSLFHLMDFSWFIFLIPFLGIFSILSGLMIIIIKNTIAVNPFALVFRIFLTLELFNKRIWIFGGLVIFNAKLNQMASLVDAEMYVLMNWECPFLSAHYY